MKENQKLGIKEKTLLSQVEFNVLLGLVEDKINELKSCIEPPSPEDYIGSLLPSDVKMLSSLYEKLKNQEKNLTAIN